MRGCRREFAVWVGTVFLSLLPSSVHADPIRVTGGSAVAYFFSDRSLATLSGQGLAFVGEGAGGHNGGPGAVGTMGNLDGSFSFFPISGPLTVTVNDTTYRVLLDGDLRFTTEPFLVEAPAGGFGTQTTFQVPFLMTGDIQGYAPTGPFDREFGELLFDIDVFGGGIATQTKTFNSPGFYAPPQAAIVYTFQDTAPSPTPEPASLLLLGTGAAALVARQRRL